MFLMILVYRFEAGLLLVPLYVGANSFVNRGRHAFGKILQSWNLVVVMFFSGHPLYR